MIPLFVVVAAFLAFSLAPYLTFDPARSRLPLRPGFGMHFPVLVAHVLFGSVALITCCLQVWPRLRQRYPRAHRLSGRIYVFGGVLPAGLLAVVAGVAAVTPGFAGRVGNVTLALTWLAVTFTGWRMARRRCYAEHRRWMIRSFALCTSIVVNRLWTVALLLALQPFRHSWFGGSQQALTRSAVEAAIWLSWVVNLLIAEWWLDRRRTTRRALHPEPPRPPLTEPTGQHREPQRA